MKKIVSLFVFGMFILMLGACGQEAKDVAIKEDQTEDQVQANDAEKQSDKEVDESKKKESKLGSRTNPVTFLKTATIDDQIFDDNGNEFAIKLDLTVTEVIRGEDAYQMLLKMNEFNEAAPEGYEWVLAKTKVKFVESETEDLSFLIDGVMNFEMISESGDIYSGDIYAVTEPDFSFEMYVGSEQEGYISKLVKAGEKTQLRYQDMSGKQVFFNLE